MFRRFVRAFGLMTLAVGLAAAQEPAAKPAPAGVIASSFRAFVVSDERFPKEPDGQPSPRNRADKMHDLVVDNALNPVVAVFSRQDAAKDGTPNTNVAVVTAKLNEMVQEKELKANRLGAFVCFLTLGKEYPEADGRDAAKRDVQAFAAAVKKLGKADAQLAVPLTLAASKSDAVTAWDIKETDALTVVFYREMKPIQRWAFTAEKPPTDDDVKAITGAVEKELRAKK